jgi:hypothetical protein
MGFELEDHEKKYRLTFEDMPGLEVLAREPDLDQMFAMNEMGDVTAKTLDAAKMKALFVMFAGLLESWNVTRKGEPVPATYEGIMTCSPGFIYKIVNALGKAVAEPDPTSPPASANGELEASIPMTSPAS